MIQGHGDDIYKYSREITSNFSSNVYNAVDLRGLKERLTEQMGLISSYPEPEPYTLENLLAKMLDCSPSNICVTNGATEAIYLIAQIFREATSAIFVPTFSEYEDACRIHKHNIIHITNTNNLKNIDIVWICNPNNPTGLVFKKELLIELIENNPQIIFILDQSYEYFTTKPTLSVSQGIKYPNVVMLHSMTKRYAIPGLRLGYITASKKILDKLKGNKMPWSVNSLAIEAGLYLIRNGLPTSLDIEEFLNQSSKLAYALQKLGFFEVLPSQTHYMLVKILKPLHYPNGIVSQEACTLKDYLANNYGILIRDASNFATLNKTYFRIASQTPKENSTLVEKITALIENSRI